MTRPFEEALREELMRATRRRPRRRLPAVIAGATVAALFGVVVMTWAGTDSAAADVDITRENGRVIVRLADLENTPDDVEGAADRAGLDIEVEGVPTGPSHVGRFVGDFSSDENVLDVEKLDGNDVTYMAFSFPEDWPGRLTVYLGQPAAAGESYRIASDAYAPGEPLACSNTLGRPLESVADMLDGVAVTVQAFDAQQQPSAAVTLGEAIEMGIGGEAITGATATSDASILIDVGRNVPPPREYPPC